MQKDLTIDSTFETIPSSQVPRARKGKHNAVVSKVLSTLLTLKAGTALKVPLLDLRKQKMENVRAALNRAGKKIDVRIATSSDDYFLYVWIDIKNARKHE
ncbi:MAG: hypothetical protein ACJ71Q_07110 [Terriglobales bacterium]|jgi:hypothetical protein